VDQPSQMFGSELRQAYRAPAKARRRDYGPFD
jgi:hypothetical protein